MNTRVKADVVMFNVNDNSKTQVNISLLTLALKLTSAPFSIRSVPTFRFP